MRWLKDPKQQAESVTLTFVAVTFVFTIISLSLAHYFLSCLPATALSIALFALTMLFYRMRRVDEFTFNAKTGEVSAKDTEDTDVK